MATASGLLRLLEVRAESPVIFVSVDPGCSTVLHAGGLRPTLEKRETRCDLTERDGQQAGERLQSDYREVCSSLVALCTEGTRDARDTLVGRSHQAPGPSRRIKKQHAWADRWMSEYIIPGHRRVEMSRDTSLKYIAQRFLRPSALVDSLGKG